MFLIVLLVVFLFEVAFRAMPIGVGKTVFGNISANITTQGIWVVVNLCVPMWRRWGKVEGWQPVDLGVPGGHIGPPLWLGVVAFFVSLIYISVANILAHFVCGVSKSVNDSTDAFQPAARLGSECLVVVPSRLLGFSSSCDDLSAGLVSHTMPMRRCIQVQVRGSELVDTNVWVYLWTLLFR